MSVRNDHSSSEGGPAIFFDSHANLSLLSGRIAVIGYGNQGRAQALNLRDSGLEVVIGNARDNYWEAAEADGFEVHEIGEAVAEARTILLLLSDEVQAKVFEESIGPNLRERSLLCFASGYNVTYGYIKPPENADTVLVAPRMIGVGVRASYLENRGFYSFMAIAKDQSGQARSRALAVAKGIGSTKSGGAVIEVSFRQETELDLFNEQCFGPAFGQALVTAVDVAVEAGYPPEAVLVEILLSGEVAYSILQMAKLGVMAQMKLHSPTSQYGSMSRGIRYANPELREAMVNTLEEIQNGAFAREFEEESERNLETLEQLREMAEETPLVILDRQTRKKLGLPE